jgi:serine/threonine protein kinase
VSSNQTGNAAIFASEFSNSVLIGTGQFFQVFRAQLSSTGELYAVKKSLNLLKGKKDREGYLREVNLLHMLGPHNNIIKHYRAWQEEAHFFIQMEYCVSNLSDYAQQILPSINNVNERDYIIANWAIELSRALHHVHKSGLLHLDIKPENVLVSVTGTLKLGDFGQAKLKKDVSDGSEGDSVYMAPELLQQNLGSLVSSATDIFSLGLLLFELCTNTVLPKEGLIWHQLRQGEARQYLHNRVDSILEELIVDMLNPQPKFRPAAVNIIERLLLFMQNIKPNNHQILDSLSPRSLHNIAEQLLTNDKSTISNNNIVPLTL